MDRHTPDVNKWEVRQHCKTGFADVCFSEQYQGCPSVIEEICESVSHWTEIATKNGKCYCLKYAVENIVDNIYLYLYDIWFPKPS